MKIKVGCDPEVFVKAGRTPISAHGLVPGTKEKPHPVENGAVQVDGMALEYNIHPAESEDEFVRYNLSVLNQLRDMLPRYELMIGVPTVTFTERVFDGAPDEAKEMGCEPDFNAYMLGAENKKPDNKGRMRSTGGHIHFGWTDGEDPGDPMHINRCCTLVKHLDAYLGLPSVLWDSDKKRRQLYGQAGCFRPKPYGVEYRPLSSAWIRDERLMRYVYRQGVRAIENLIAGERFNNYDIIAASINKSSVPNAEYILPALRATGFEMPPIGELDVIRKAA